MGLNYMSNEIRFVKFQLRRLQCKLIFIFYNLYNNFVIIHFQRYFFIQKLKF